MSWLSGEENWLEHTETLAASIEAAPLTEVSIDKDRNMYIDIDDVGYDHRDAGPWRSYGFTSVGHTRDELLDNGHIWEMDQDGGELRDYPLGDTGGGLYNICEKIIDKVLAKANEGNK